MDYMIRGNLKNRPIRFFVISAKETIEKIEEILSENKVEIKQIKRKDEGEENKDGETIRIIGQYNKKGFNKNGLISNITSIEGIGEIMEE